VIRPLTGLIPTRAWLRRARSGDDPDHGAPRSLDDDAGRCRLAFGVGRGGRDVCACLARGRGR